MAVYCLTVQYDGSRYNGWQKQGNTPNTIQEKIEAVLSRLYNIPLEIAGSGRTDAGVHALGQTASFHVEKSRDQFSCDRITAYLNQYLPEDIRILRTEQKEERFHARLLAKSKIYEYRIDMGSVRNVFQRRYALSLSDYLDAKMTDTAACPDPKSGNKAALCPDLNAGHNTSLCPDLNAGNKTVLSLDQEAMKEAAGYLLGTHDFKSFCDNKRMKKSTVRTIYSIDFVQEGSFLTIRYCGSGFLYHMVRILTGTLLEVGFQRRQPADMQQILEGMDRSLSGPSLPPQGLFLVEVSYT